MHPLKVDYADFINLGGTYANHLGIAEDAIKMGARMGLVEDSAAKRVLRMIDAQGDSPEGRLPLFAADILAAPAIMENPNEFKTWFSGLDNKGKKEQQGANAIPGMHGHHGASVSSIAASVQDMPIGDAVETLNEINRNPAYADVPLTGTNREDMLGLMEAQHLHDKQLNAHMDPLHPGVSNTGYWQTDQSYHDVADPEKRAARIVDETLRPQVALSKAAFNSPINQEAIAVAAADLGITPEELMSVETNKRGKTKANQHRDELKKTGFDSKGMQKVLQMDRGGRARSNITSNAGVLDDRTGISTNRRDMGVSGNEDWAQDTLGKWVRTLRSNNPRRRL